MVGQQNRLTGAYLQGLAIYNNKVLSASESKLLYDATGIGTIPPSPTP
jgi:hypothetical protein